MAHPDKDSGTEQKDRFMQNFVNSRSKKTALPTLAREHVTQRVAGKDDNVKTTFKWIWDRLPYCVQKYE